MFLSSQCRDLADDFDEREIFFAFWSGSWAGRGFPVTSHLVFWGQLFATGTLGLGLAPDVIYLPFLNFGFQIL